MLDVLIAHESGMTRALMRSTLEDAGATIREAGSVQACVAACQEQRPDVVLVESSLCERDGIPLLARFKGDPELFSIAVVLLVEQPSAAEVIADLDHGAQDIVMLPAQEADLIARVRAAARTKELQEEILARGRIMEDLVYGDPLTRLANRRFIMGRLASAVAGASRHGHGLSVAMIDVDHFKALNDELGHAAGDEALVTVADRMAGRLRREDDLGRLGGEEFLAILPDTTGEDAEHVADDLRAAVGDRPMVLEGRGRTVTVSIGWASWDGNEGADELLKRADAALYRAKADGRNVVRGPEGTRFRRVPAPESAQTPASG